MFGEKAVVRQLAKAALDAGSEAELSEKAAETAVKVAPLKPYVGTTDRLWFPSEGLPLYRSII